MLIYFCYCQLQLNPSDSTLGSGTLELVAKEYKPSLWRYGAVFLGLLTGAGLLAIWRIGDPLWGNTLRLVTFIFFAGSVVCGLKLMEGSYIVRLEYEDGRLLVGFYKGKDRVGEESFSGENLLSVNREHLQKGVPRIYSWEEVYLTGRFEKKGDDVHLFHYGGRPLPFDPATANRIYEYLRKETGF